MQERLNDDEIRSFADEHLLYEISMVAGLTRRLARFRTLLTSRPPDATRDGLTDELFHLTGRNADIEAFTVHTRVLLDFLYRDRRKQNDAMAADFFSDGSWPQVRPEKTASLAKVHRRVGTEIAHLSYRRAASAEPQEWPYGEIWHDLSHVLRVFVDNADQDRLSQDFREQAGAELATSMASKTRLALLQATNTDYPLTFPVSSAEYHGGTATAPLPRSSSGYELD